MTLTDETREKLIDAYKLLMELEPDGYRRNEAWKRMSGLIASRSPEAIQRMERERGLRAP